MAKDITRTTATSDGYVAENGNGVRMPDEAHLRAQSWGELLVMIPKRLLALAAKMIGIKMLILYGATVLLLVSDRFPAWAWLATAGFVIGGREMMKYLKDIRG